MKKHLPCFFSDGPARQQVVWGLQNRGFGNPRFWAKHPVSRAAAYFNGLLNYHGPTVVNRIGATKAATIFRLWAQLFREGPEVIELTGSYEWADDDEPVTGRYARIVIKRDELVQAFQTLVDCAEKASTGAFYILHFGI